MLSLRTARGTSLRVEVHMSQGVGSVGNTMIGHYKALIIFVLSFSLAFFWFLLHCSWFFLGSGSFDGKRE